MAFQGRPDAIWVYDLESKALTKLTFEAGEHETPVWSADGQRVAYASTRQGYARAVFTRAADGSGPEELVFSTDAHVHLSSWSPDGKTLLYDQTGPEDGFDVWTHHPGDRAPQQLHDFEAFLRAS